ncbi:MAG: hypothetical protein WA864_12325, partial [Acetobacteraceae bacterium]
PLVSLVIVSAIVHWGTYGARDAPDKVLRPTRTVIGHTKLVTVLQRLSCRGTYGGLELVTMPHMVSALGWTHHKLWHHG